LTSSLVREDAIRKGIKVIVSRKKKRNINVVTGPKGRPNTQTNWSTVCRPQEELRLRFGALRLQLAAPFAPNLLFLYCRTE
jgi:hypothetical protein